MSIAEMVDVVSPNTMPSESEVLVARCFLTKILRNSMRKNRFKGKNEPSSRPHSWHSSKLTVEEPEPLGEKNTSVPVWQQKEARLKESFCQTSQNNWDLLTMSNMEKLVRPAHPFSPDHASQIKYSTLNEPPDDSEGRGDTFSCLSTGSNLLLLDSSSLGEKGTNAESIFFKGLQDEGPLRVERPEYYQTPCQQGSLLDEKNSSWISRRFRPSVGSVWQLPEKKKSKSPPPPSQMPKDGRIASSIYSEESEKNPTQKIQKSNIQKTYRRSVERLAQGNNFQPEKNTKFRSSVTSLSDKDWFHPCRASEHIQLHPNKHFSLSSTDVRHPHYASMPAQHKQNSDENQLYPHGCLTHQTKIQSVGSYYRSLQDLPMKVSSHKFVWCSSESMAGTNQENERYTILVNKKRNQQMTHTENKWHNGLLKSVSLLDSQIPERSHWRQPQDVTKRSDGHINNMKRIFPAHQSSNDKVRLSRPYDPWVPQKDHRLSLLETPLLHSLAQESRIQMEVTPTSIVSSQNLYDSMVSKGTNAHWCGNRYATTLRNEVQQKRAQLQKSCSAATLTCDIQDEGPAEWKYAEPSFLCSVSSSNSYKENLKEAQARVLQATSFQRRDLEPLGAEAPEPKASNGRIRGSKRSPLAKRMHSFSEPDKIDKVGVDREQQDGAFDQMRFSEEKQAFSKTVKLVCTSHIYLNPSQDTSVETKERRMSGEAQETHSSVEISCFSPPGGIVLQEQQKLESFAEYQATWNEQKRTSQAKIQGRYYSAENILDGKVVEKAAGFHERSRSSPSPDFCTKNIPSLWRDHQETMTYNYDSRNEAPVLGISVHQASRDAVNPTIEVSSGPCSVSPVLDSQKPARTLQGNTVSAPGSHLGLEATCSSQDLLSAVLPDPVVLQPFSNLDITAKSPTPPGSPRLCRKPQSVKRTEDADSKKEQSASSCCLSLLAASNPHFTSPHIPLLRLMDKQSDMSVQEASSPWSENDSKLFEVVMNMKSEGTKILGAVSTYSPHSRNTSGILNPCSNIDSVDADKTWPSSAFNVCIQQPTNDLGCELEQLKVKDSILDSNLKGEHDAKTEQLVRKIMGEDKSLVEVLDQTGRKTTMDAMEGLFVQEKQILEDSQQRRRSSSGSRLLTTSRRVVDDVSAVGSLVSNSSYYNTSAPKAELLIKMKDMQEQFLEQDSEDELDVDLANKKQELISSLAKKLEVLREARQSLQEDIENNEALGSEVETIVQRFCLPNQLDRFQMFVGDLDKVVSLLLSLSGRLARVENALDSLEDGAPPDEKRTLTEKRKLLMRQHEDAKELKENLDRRERLVSSFMEAHLNPERLDDYRHFVKMKSALIIEQRNLEDKIKLGEEQLKCLLDSMPLEQRS